MKNTNHPSTNHKEKISYTFLSLLCAGVMLLSPTRVSAVEDPAGCSFPNGAGNTSIGGINFSSTQNPAHVGDTIQIFPSLGMGSGACKATNVVGIVYVSTGPVATFMTNQTLEPTGASVQCPGDPKCVAGPYQFTIAPGMVGASVVSPNGTAAGVAKAVRAVENGFGNVLTSTPEQLADFHTATLGIVTPCIQIFKQCAYPQGQTCFQAGQPIGFTGYVTNCGDITLTNVVIADSRTGILLAPNGIPLLQPLTLVTGQVVNFKGSYTATLQETCSGKATNNISVRGTDTTQIGGPNASVTNTATAICNICVVPCLQVTKDCTTNLVGEIQTVSGVVSNCGNIAITNIIISDNVLGTITTIPTLLPGDGIPYSTNYTTIQCGATPNVVTASGNTECGAPITARATNTCYVICPPKICVTKTVACYLGNDVCDTFGKSATGVIGDNGNSAFCYSITVNNCGVVPMSNVTVIDTIYGNLTTNFFPSPSTVFVVGDSKTYTFKASVNHSVTNVVNVSGRSVIDGTLVSTNDHADVKIVPARVRCDKEFSVDGGPLVSAATLSDQNPHEVVWYVTVHNTGQANLMNVQVTDLGLPCGVSLAPFILDAGQSTAPIPLCTNTVTCPIAPVTNTVSIFANQYSVGTNHTAICGHDITGADTNITVASQCSAILSCVPPNACRVTGGGRTDDGFFPDNVRYVTYGGQVGAPVGNRVCEVVVALRDGNPCIQGNWEHVRHDKGGNEGNFHAKVYDTLECACLDTTTTPLVVSIGNQTYTNLVYGAGTTVNGTCNPGNRVAGPEPRKAPANKIVFTGIGDWTATNGRRAGRSCLFRVDVEDRGEPGGSHPKGGTPPPDRVRIRIWVLTTSELAQLHGTGPGDQYLLNFRNAISACIGTDVQDGATVANGTAVFGVRAPDIDDGGEQTRGNHQIHPAIMSCDPFTTNRKVK